MGDNRLPLVIWAAGFFDGEGCICLAKRNDGTVPRFTVHLSVGQVDVRPLIIFKELFGGSTRIQYRANPMLNHRMAYEWKLCGDKVIGCLREMLPYFVVKKEQAEMALQFKSLPWRGRRGDIYRNNNQIAVEMDYWKKMREAKKNNVSNS